MNPGPNVLIACPHCGLEKTVPAARIPKNALQVTCPQCKRGFPLRAGMQPLSASTPLPPQVLPTAAPANEASTPRLPAGTAATAPTPAMERWFVAAQFRQLLVVIIVMTILAFLLLLLRSLRPGFISQIELLQHLLLAISAVISVAGIYWRIRTPVYELSASGLRMIGSPLASGRLAVNWQDIIGLAVQETGLFGIRERRLQLVIDNKDGPLRELLVRTKMVDRPEALLARLQAQTQPLTAKSLAATGPGEMKGGSGEVRFAACIASRAGLAASRTLIPWEMVREITTPAFNPAGYGGITIVYDDGAKVSRLPVAAKMTADYPNFVRALLRYAPDAAIDAGVAKIVTTPPQEALQETIAIILLIVGLAVGLFAVYLTMQYEPVVAWKALFSLITLAAWLVPFSAAVQLFAGQFMGRSSSAVSKLSWSGGASAAPLVALLAVFLLFPSGWHTMRGDLAFNKGDLVRAEGHYTRALACTPENRDARFSLGLVYRDKKEYERAYECLVAVYLVDADNWLAFGMELIPDTLLKMKKYDEAIAWCDRISREHSRRRSIVAAMTNKKNEIVQSKSRQG